MNKYLDIFNKWKEKKEFGSWCPLKNHAITCIYGINVESIWHAHFHRMVFFLYALYFHWDLQCRLTWTLKTTKTSQRICCYISKVHAQVSVIFIIYVQTLLKELFKKAEFWSISHMNMSKEFFFNQLLVVA